MTPRTQYLIGDTREVLEAMPARSVDLIMTSPPFLGLRSYLPADHPDKALEMGSELTPADFIDGLLDVTEAFARVLAPHGSIVIELGDTSSGSGGAGGDYSAGRVRDGQPRFAGSAAAARSVFKQARADAAGWPAAKSLCLIPELYRVALAYGVNPLNGRQTDPWIVRNVVSWVRRNPPPGRLGDKLRRGTSTLVIATKSPDRWYDDFDVRTPATGHARTAKGVDSAPAGGRSAGEGRGGGWATLRTQHKSHTAPPLDWWEIASRSYRSSTDHKHYASYPEKLCEIPILTMCPPRVCTWCGAAPRRRTAPTAEYSEKLGESIYPKAPDEATRQLRGRNGSHSKDIVRQHEHVGWDECACPDFEGRWRPGVVLDPFAGTGTTLAVAARFGRDAIGIDLDERNAAIATERIDGLSIEKCDRTEGAA